MERIQIPLRLSFAVTIHKVQSLTLPLAKVNIGEKIEKNIGLTYVAFSRVKRLEDLLLVPFDYKRLTNIKLPSYVIEHDEKTKKLVEETIRNYKDNK